jgi:hypothetical protein
MVAWRCPIAQYRICSREMFALSRVVAGLLEFSRREQLFTRLCAVTCAAESALRALACARTLACIYQCTLHMTHAVRADTHEMNLIKRERERDKNFFFFFWL